MVSNLTCVPCIHPDWRPRPCDRCLLDLFTDVPAGVSCPDNRCTGPVIQAPLPPGKPGKEIERIIERMVPVPGPERIVYIDKPSISTVLKFPEIAKLHDNVIAVATAAPHKGRTTVVATIGPDSDNVYRGGILLRQEAVPFLGREREWHGGIWYGIGGRNTLQGELEFLPMRIGSVYPSAKGIIGLENEGNLNGQLLLGVRF